MDKKSYDVELSWSNWNEYIIKSSQKLDAIGDISTECYFDVKLINRYYAMLNSYLYTRKSLIEDFKDIEQELSKIGEVLYKKDYLQDLKDNPEDPSLKEIQNKILIKLNKVLGKVQNNLSNSKIFPKTNQIEKVLGAVRNQKW